MVVRDRESPDPVRRNSATGTSCDNEMLPFFMASDRPGAAGKTTMRTFMKIIVAKAKTRPGAYPIPKPLYLYSIQWLKAVTVQLPFSGQAEEAASRKVANLIPEAASPSQPHWRSQRLFDCALTILTIAPDAVKAIRVIGLATVFNDTASPKVLGGIIRCRRKGYTPHQLNTAIRDAAELALG